MTTAGAGHFLARVFVTLKPTVNDPQGLTVRSALHSLGYDRVDSVRAGKYLELRLNATDETDAARQVTGMCQKLLANPVIEEFRFDLQQQPAPG